MTRALSVEEIRRLPAAVPLVDAGRALGKGRTWCHEAARAGTFPLPLLRLGRSYVVRRVDLLEYLGLSPPTEGDRPRFHDTAGPNVQVIPDNLNESTVAPTANIGEARKIGHG